MRKLFLSLALVVVAALSASADTYNYLNLVGSTIQSVALKSVKKITFEGTNVVVTSADGTQTTAALSTLNYINFTSEATGVRGMASNPADLCLQNGRVVAHGAGELQLYNAGGQLVRQQRVVGDRSELSLDCLPRGLYVARLGNKVIKLMH